MTRYKKLQKMAAMAATVSMIISTCTPTFAKPSIGGGGGGRPAGGGTRPGGGGGGGMARPAPSAGMARPSMNMPAARPSTPSLGNAVARPAPASHMNTPSPSVNRPSLGGGGGNLAPATRPSPGPGGVATTRPAPQPGGGQQPSIKPPSNVKPTTRPSPGGIFGEGSGVAGGSTRPNIERPSVGRPDGNRPDIAKPDVTRPNVNKPDFIRPDVTRPDLTRPDLTRPDLTRPGGGGGGVNAGDRPSFGNLTKPAIDRPDNSRPNIGRPDGNRPDIVRPDNTRPNINRPDGNRPDFVRPDNTRPNVGRPDGLRPETRPAPVKPDRPLIGGNRPHVGDNHQFLNTNNNNIINNLTQNNVTQNNVTNIWGNNSNIGNNFTNRPSWDRPYYNRPNWGWGSNNWGDHWHSNCIHPHYNWYNGCWNGYWNSGWYSPLAWGAVGWGLGVWTTRWSSYTPVYYNPYYVANTATTPYNYSQPVVVNNYVSADGGSSTQSAAPAAAGQPPAPAGQQPAPQPPSPASSPGLAKFDDGLSSFKEGQYEAALASFDAALKLLPSDPVVHEIRALDLFALGNYSGAAASLNSLLTAAPGMDWTTMSSLYGDTDDYVAQLRKLEKHCQSEPTDAAAAFVLAYHYLVTGAKEEAIHALRAVVKNQPKDVTAKRMLDALAPPADVEPPKPGETQVAEKEPAEGKDEPETDLVGTWIAKADGAEIQLTITEDSTFTWKATQKDQPAIELSGDLNATGDAIVLESKSQGSMSGNVISKGADQWQFRLAGSPAKDPGLLFARSK